MNSVSAMLVAYACISPVEPAGAAHTVAYMCAAPRVESTAAVKPRAKRKSVRKVKLADRCGSQKAVWRKLKNGHLKYRCV